MADLAIVACVLVGAWSALDGSAVGHFLVSRPIVSGTLAGIALGDPASGFLVGAVLEGTYLGRVPAGGARLPEPGPAAVVATYALVNGSGPGGLAFALGLGVALASISGLTVIAQRLANGAITRRVATGSPGRSELARAQWLCIGVDASRGLALTGLGILLVSAIPADWSAEWPLGEAATIWLFGLPSALTVGALLRDWIRTRGRAWLVFTGCVGGVVLALST